MHGKHHRSQCAERGCGLNGAHHALVNDVAALREFIGLDPAQRLVKYVKRCGPYKGELISLTVPQFRELVGADPKPVVIVDGLVAWEYALDQVADAMGYPSDEALHDAVEHALKMRRELEDSERELRIMEDEVVAQEPQRGPVVRVVSNGKLRQMS